MLKSFALQKPAVILAESPAGDCGTSFKDADAQANQFAHYFLARGIRPGDAVCVVMENSLDLLLVFLALVKIGALPAMINTNLSGDSLSHCITVVSAVAVVMDPKFVDSFAEIREKLGSDMAYYTTRAPVSPALPAFISANISQSELDQVPLSQFSSFLLHRSPPRDPTQPCAIPPAAWTQCATYSPRAPLVCPNPLA